MDRGSDPGIQADGATQAFRLKAVRLKVGFLNTSAFRLFPKPSA